MKKIRYKLIFCVDKNISLEEIRLFFDKLEDKYLKKEINKLPGAKKDVSKVSIINEI